MSNELMTLQNELVNISFHRTVRVALNKVSCLPPSLGLMKIYKVADYRQNCPLAWENDAIFLALHETEAMWMSFEPKKPTALLIGAGGINAIDGKPYDNKLEKDNYIVCPPQPWLDGWKNQNGNVYQFVATEAGEGNTVGEQILEKEHRSNGISISLYESKMPLESTRTPCEFPTDDASSLCQYASGSLNLGYLDYCTTASGYYSYACSEMGVGKGGEIQQKIYPDPYELDVWKEEAASKFTIYLVNAKQFAIITGNPMPPMPKATAEYTGHWFGMDDKELHDVEGTHVFDDLKPVGS